MTDSTEESEKQTTDLYAQRQKVINGILEQLIRDIGVLLAQVVALAALACAMLESNAQRETRLSKHLTPALHRLGRYDMRGIKDEAALVAWVTGYLDGPTSADRT